MKVQMFGATELLSQFHKLNDLVAAKYIDESLQSGAEVVMEAVKQRAPAGATGVLRESLSVQTISATRTHVVKVLQIDSKAYYWLFLEYGTKSASGGQRIQALKFIKKTFRNRKAQARQEVRDKFRDLILGFD